MILDFMEDLNREWNHLQYWFEQHYDDPLLWTGIVVAVVLFMAICASYLGKDNK